MWDFPLSSFLVLGFVDDGATVSRSRPGPSLPVFSSLFLAIHPCPKMNPASKFILRCPPAVVAKQIIPIFFPRPRDLYWSSTTVSGRSLSFSLSCLVLIVVILDLRTGTVSSDEESE